MLSNDKEFRNELNLLYTYVYSIKVIILFNFYELENANGRKHF